MSGEQHNPNYCGVDQSDRTNRRGVRRTGDEHLGLVFEDCPPERRPAVPVRATPRPSFERSVSRCAANGPRFAPGSMPKPSVGTRKMERRVTARSCRSSLTRSIANGHMHNSSTYRNDDRR